MTTLEALEKATGECRAAMAQLNRLQLLIEHAVYLFQTPGRRIDRAKFTAWLQAVAERGAASDAQFMALLESAHDSVPWVGGGDANGGDER